MINIIGIGHESDANFDIITATAFISKVKNNKYLNIQITNKGKKNNKYFFAKYIFDNQNSFKLSYIDMDEIEILIKSKKIKGDLQTSLLLENKKNKALLFINTKITDTSKNIENVIFNYDKILFKDYMIFDRILKENNSHKKLE